MRWIVLGEPDHALRAVLQGRQAEQGLSTEADVWKQAHHSGLVVDAVSDEEKPAPRPVLDNDYEIRACRPDLEEDPAQNKAEAEREARIDLQLDS